MPTLLSVEMERTIHYYYTVTGLTNTYEISKEYHITRECSVSCQACNMRYSSGVPQVWYVRYHVCTGCCVNILVSRTSVSCLLVSLAGVCSRTQTQLELGDILICKKQITHTLAVKRNMKKLQIVLPVILTYVC